MIDLLEVDCLSRLSLQLIKEIPPRNFRLETELFSHVIHEHENIFLIVNLGVNLFLKLENMASGVSLWN
jgi:hypothetical protein